MKVVSIYVDQKPERGDSQPQAPPAIVRFPGYPHHRRDPALRWRLKTGRRRRLIYSAKKHGKKRSTQRQGSDSYPRYESLKQCAKVFEERMEKIRWPLYKRNKPFITARKKPHHGGKLRVV